ncbi:MAG TPA: SDR family oxidoreductase [Candidatus Binataceae bacterium]|jgi:NAD(P)-dependent dehydrogenase (short-subunit alcohol dehydrogenase family)|nr:SDR family oxidoreductase [Candidatus Binataceae bacterium]
MDPAGKVAVITGGGSGIGRTTALRLAAEGASILIVDLNVGMGEESVSLIEKKGAPAAFAKADVTNGEQMNAALQAALSRFNRLDILYNNAGLALPPPGFPGVALDVWRRVVDVDLQAVILGCQLAYPLMKQRGGGAIVNTASMAGLYPMPLDPVYAAAKAGVVHLTYSLVNWQKDGIRVNAVCPGITDTPMVARMLENRKKAELKSVKPQNLLQPDAIADAVLNFIHDDRLAGQVVEVRPSGPHAMPARGIVGRH